MACRPVEHPPRKFQPTVCLQLFQRAAEDDLVSLVDGTMNANSATKPRMMPIKNLAKNDPVGVLKPRCTMAPARISPWRRMPRSRVPSNGPGRFFAAQFSAACTTNMSAFDFSTGTAWLTARRSAFRFHLENRRQFRRSNFDWPAASLDARLHQRALE